VLLEQFCYVLDENWRSVFRFDVVALCVSESEDTGERDRNGGFA